ncbi:MAG: GntR family transcriptional regulator [Anaerotignum sp.]
MLDFKKLELNPSEPVYLQIVSFVKRQIFIGTVEQGESLPSRREMAALLKINPNTVQKAFRLLEEEGLVVTPPNAVSILHWDEEIFAAIQKELTAGLVVDFVAQAKANGLTLDMVMALLKDAWAKGDER